MAIKALERRSASLFIILFLKEEKEGVDEVPSLFIKRRDTAKGLPLRRYNVSQWPFFSLLRRDVDCFTMR